MTKPNHAPNFFSVLILVLAIGTLPAFGQTAVWTNRMLGQSFSASSTSPEARLWANPFRADTAPGGSEAADDQSQSPAQPIIPAETPKKPAENPAEPESHGTRLRWQHLPRNIVHDERAIFTSPLHINRKNAKWWILIGATTAVLIATDKEVSDATPDSGAAISIGRWSSRLGADYSIYPLASLFYFGGKLGDNPRARDTARIGIEALADAEIAVNILKVAARRARPGERDGNGHFWDGGDGFPSGHSIKSWALASVVAHEFPHPRIIPVLAYTLAATVSASRVASRRHFPSDALVGSAMGWFIGDYVYRHHHAPSQKSAIVPWLASHVSLGFSIGP